MNCCLFQYPEIQALWLYVSLDHANTPEKDDGNRDTSRIPQRQNVAFTRPNSYAPGPYVVYSVGGVERRRRSESAETVSPGPASEIARTSAGRPKCFCLHRRRPVRTGSELCSRARYGRQRSFPIKHFMGNDHCITDVKSGHSTYLFASFSPLTDGFVRLLRGESARLRRPIRDESRSAPWRNVSDRRGLR